METITISIPDDMLELIDKKRGDVPRSAFVRRIITKALAMEKEGGSKK